MGFVWHGVLRSAVGFLSSAATLWASPAPALGDAALFENGFGVTAESMRIETRSRRRLMSAAEQGNADAQRSAEAARKPAVCLTADAASTIAVLDFELRDLTLTPNQPAEVDRTTRVAPALRSALQRRGLSALVGSAQRQAEADKSVGYLFDHPDEAATLGAAVGAQWIAVGRLHKPSELFAYLQVELVDACARRSVGSFSVEIKGRGRTLLERGTEALAEQLAQAIRALEARGQSAPKP